MLRGILASVAFGIAASGLAQQSLVEYPAETSTFFPPTPTGISSGPSGLVWFVNLNAAHSIGTVTLDGDTTGIAQPPGDVATGAITGAPATYLWAGASKNILKITRDPTPTFGVTFALFPLPDASLYHSIDSIAWDGASTVWFTDFVGGARKLGRLDTTSGSVQESALSNDCMFPAGFGRDMVRASDGNVWFTSSSGACRIMADGSVLLQPLTSPAGGITSGPDGRIWVAEYTGTAHLEAFDPHDCPGAACQIATYDLPSPVHDLHGLAGGPDDRIWFVSHGAPDVAGSVKTDGSDFQFVTLPSGSKPEKITAGPAGDNSVWFTESGTLKIGRITGLAVSPALYLQGGRFRVEVSWSVPSQGTSGDGTPVPLTGDTGYFWFFNSANVELVLKVLDARSLNGRFWVFYGALSNVQYTIKITDTVTGAVKTYANASGNLASFADTSAFQPDAAGAAAPATEVGSASAAAIEALSRAERRAFDAALSKRAKATLGPASACVADDATLCLNQSRFQVTVHWAVPSQGTSGQGTAVPISGDTGYLWFFSDNNVELIIKVLDGTGINGHFWVFYGALSNVQYTITVRDTQTGAERTYDNPDGTQASHADTAAF